MYKELYPLTYYFYPLLENELGPGRSLFDEQLRRPSAPDVESLLYVHIPFCHDLCSFCPFHVKVARQEGVYERYVAVLCREFELLAGSAHVAGRRFRAVYFGGGSPSILGAQLIGRIFDVLQRRFDIAADAEISFEGEPKTLGDPDLLELLAARGVQRVSFGVQTYDVEQRKRFRIQATLEDVARVTENARRIGFDDINVDMMYDLPGQTVTTLYRDLEHLESAQFDSIDYYNLHYYAFPKPFKAALDRGDIPAKPSEETHFALAQEVRWRLGQLGYSAVADQVFSKKQKVCEYFRLLWGGGDGDHAAETIAAGSSARGYIGGFSYMNSPDVPGYSAAVERGELPIAKISSRLDIPESRGAFFMTKFARIAKTRTRALASLRPGLLDAWLESGLLRETPSSYELTERGRLWTPNMMKDLLGGEQAQVASGALTLIEKRPGARTGSF